MLYNSWSLVVTKTPLSGIIWPESKKSFNSSTFYQVTHENHSCSTQSWFLSFKAVWKARIWWGPNQPKYKSTLTETMNISVSPCFMKLRIYVRTHSLNHNLIHPAGFFQKIIGGVGQDSIRLKLLHFYFCEHPSYFCDKNKKNAFGFPT